ncbi:DUF4440 domain-containing protein [Roseibium sp. FZY0029]|uniref:nuclear transport factor 2 family protein n=1 Tax=Roseibium sp. FZY0029 TaxID=3116647 RepID=UPI002E9D6E70|nr:DUF4440 domain-containing protein [Roseibium sp. FZY0029]
MPDTSLLPEDVETLTRLEESLWQAETRYDPVLMDRVFADDFFEFGRSGRVYSREDLILPASAAQPIDVSLPLPRLKFTAIDTHSVLVTYVSEVRRESGEVDRANRSSIWSRQDGSWKLRFHQGTPFQP